MRIGTWNVENRLMTDKHRELLLDQKCDVWLLTELNPKWFDDSENKIFHFHCHLSSRVMGRNQHWAAVLTVLPLEPKVAPHESSASAVVDGITFCSTILPWRGVKSDSPPWQGSNHAEMTKNTIDMLLSKLPQSDLVWGGDWNHSLIGKEYAEVWEDVIMSSKLLSNSGSTYRRRIYCIAGTIAMRLTTLVSLNRGRSIARIESTPQGCRTTKRTLSIPDRHGLAFANNI